ncbi:MAG: esterase/lipase family protein [Vicinamibacterales bacterium]
MAEKLLIVHGYSDGSTSFQGLGDFLVAQKLYEKENVFYLDYSSMNDHATFRDFADKLDSDHQTRLRGQRVDVACHSTGSLVVRAWLTLHAQRTLRRRLRDVPCPVDRLICFAPANFGSDLAALGQSFLSKFRTTFFNSNAHKEDFLESGKMVLQGLEPASPFQWELSCYDLHDRTTYFSPERPAHQRCYPFVFAAGEAYTGVEAKLLKQRGAAGTDGTVRIPGTSLNTRGCSLDFRDTGATLVWWDRTKFDDIPFAVFAGFNHGNIINPDHPGWLTPHGPGSLAVDVLRSVQSLESYEQASHTFTEICEKNYTLMPKERQDAYQQFFFRVRDDVDQIVEDYFIDFYVATRDGHAHEDLTLFFDKHFEGQVTRHSAEPSHRVFMMNCGRLHEFWDRLIAADAVLMLEITGTSALPDVRYQRSQYVAFDPKADLAPGEPKLLHPNTTTLVDVVLNRRQADRLLVIKDCTLKVIVEQPVTVAEPLKGRAELVVPERQAEQAG